MQGHRRLTGAGASLHDQRAAEVGADDAVLLGLDGRDDVVHPAGPLRRQRGEQCALALHLLPGAAAVEQGLVEDLVVDAGHLAARHRQVPPGANAHRLARRRLVEGARLLRAPVDQEGALVVVAQADAADVAVVGAVHRFVQQQAAEHQTCVDIPQLGELVLVEAREGVALAARLMVAPDAVAAHAGQPLLRLGTQLVQPLIQPSDHGALAFELRFQHAHGHLSFPGRQSTTSG